MNNSVNNMDIKSGRIVKTVTLILSPEDWKKIEDLANKWKISSSMAVKLIVLQYLNNYDLKNNRDL